ncbi:MAG: alternative ribosome rescue aminoacyl-tRNA hydrolase ArfB [Gammaproteobacteria bacterium]|nr:alternative ribosome rescue aminoacyl-tRNA hydrolase ArfB [Gammaproteobacteria bacterium]
MTAPELKISQRVGIPLAEIDFKAVRAQGPGGQNVNKTATAVELRFDIQQSSLPDFYKRRLLGRRDRRINQDGVVVIKAQSHRTQERNREAALERLADLIRSAGAVRKKRIPTKPGPRAREKRLESKTRRGRVKALRKKVVP